MAMGATAGRFGGAASSDLHHQPPMAPSALILRSSRLAPSMILLLLGLAFAAAIENGALLTTWDEPIQRAVEAARTPTMNAVMAAITELGDKYVIVALVGLSLPLVWRRCHSLAFVMLAATIARPLLEFTLKSMADRPRPDLERLLPGNGPSFPSGHVLAAIALWGLLPPIVALFTNKKTWWWASVAFSGFLIVAISASRVYLGLHWFSDVIGGLLVGALYLVGVERLLAWRHERHGCAPDEVLTGRRSDLRSHPSSS